MTYKVVTASWRDERYLVIRPSGKIVYADADHLTALAVCADLNRLSQDTK